METKFKIGDKIRYTVLNDPNWDWEVIDIIFEKKLVIEVGMGYFENCYILHNNVHGYSFVNFNKEPSFHIVDSFKSIIISSCPQCNGELKEQWSDWAKMNIKKCKACGWC